MGRKKISKGKAPADKRKPLDDDEIEQIIKAAEAEQEALHTGPLRFKFLKFPRPKTGNRQG